MRTLLLIALTLLSASALAEENQSAGDCLETLASKERSQVSEKSNLPNDEKKKEQSQSSDVVKQ